MVGQTLAATARRVVVKSRYVVLKKAGATSVSTHLRYIERDGVTREGQRGQAYGPEIDTADLKAFEERGRGERHQFRFIVSVEDAEQLEALRDYTREFMQRVATDLETRLDWVAVDHWDTDNPHTHVVLRGRAANGQDLVIAPDYMAHGMRMRASDLATEWLGPRTELEIRQGLLREVEQDRLTSLDRALLRQASMDIVDLTEKPIAQERSTLLRARLQRLEALDLAERIGGNRWRLSPRIESTLKGMGERGDILRTMNRALKGQQREYVTFEAGLQATVIGRIAGKGLADELSDRGYLVVDGIDGRGHFVKLAPGADLAALPVGGIVELKSASQPRAVDHSIVASAQAGIYRTADHFSKLREANKRDPSTTVEIHVRRLEALRRAGVVERIGEGIWQVPPDLVQRVQRLGAGMAAGPALELRSDLPIEQQVRVVAATWLDRQLLSDTKDMTSQGFGAETRNAMRERVDFLAQHGLAERRGQNVVLARNLLATLRDRELFSVSQSLQDETSRVYRPLQNGVQVSGVYRRSMQLVSGRFALLDDGFGFSLVPWRPVVDQRLRQHVSAVVRGSSVTWELGRQHGV